MQSRDTVGLVVLGLHHSRNRNLRHYQNLQQSPHLIRETVFLKCAAGVATVLMTTQLSKTNSPAAGCTYAQEYVYSF